MLPTGRYSTGNICGSIQRLDPPKYASLFRLFSVVQFDILSLFLTLGRMLHCTRLLLQLDNRNCIFVGNLPLGTEDEDLWEIFSQSAGDIEYVRVIRDRDYKVSKGFAYVKFKVR